MSLIPIHHVVSMISEHVSFVCKANELEWMASSHWYTESSPTAGGLAVDRINYVRDPSFWMFYAKWPKSSILS
jgi:hypothetical protein